MEKLNDNLLDELLSRCPQLGLLMGIIDIRGYGYEFVWEGDYGKFVKIENELYFVKIDYIEKLLELIKLEECMTLSPRMETIDKIYDLYCKISNGELMEEVRKRRELYFFENVHDVYSKGEKIFHLMDTKNGVVASMLFYIYH